MEVDVAVDPPAAHRQRRSQKWAVGLQPQTTRPTSCQNCGIVFSVGDVRVTTWGSRSTSRWCCLACLPRRAQTTDEYEPTGEATADHKAAVEAAVATEAAELSARATERPRASAQQEGTSTQLENGASNAWDDNRIPNQAWLDNLTWESLLKVGANTYVQIPDRFLDAVLTARRKTLEATAAATDAGEDSTAAWKLTLLLDSLLLSNSRPGATCAEVLEERLAWFWGGQWAELWIDPVGQSPPAAQK